MEKQSGEQKEITKRVMDEYKHGELKSGKAGKGGTVKNPKQAIAIALSEAGASKNATPAENKKNLEKTKSKQRRRKIPKQEQEGHM
jgi:hypothetical protein